jgi:hypothetical protein
VSPAPERIVYEKPSETHAARMLAICHTELPGVYAWLLGYAATGVPPSKPRGHAGQAAPDNLDADGAGNVRVIGSGR